MRYHDVRQEEAHGDGDGHYTDILISVHMYNGEEWRFERVFSFEACSVVDTYHESGDT